MGLPPTTTDQRSSLANLLLADRPDLSTEEIFVIHRTLDVILGLLLITNYMRSVGISVGENGAIGFAVSGPIITKPYLEAILYGILPPAAPTTTPSGVRI